MYINENNKLFQTQTQRLFSQHKTIYPSISFSKVWGRFQNGVVPSFSTFLKIHPSFEQKCPLISILLHYETIGSVQLNIVSSLSVFYIDPIPFTYEIKCSDKCIEFCIFLVVILCEDNKVGG